MRVPWTRDEIEALIPKIEKSLHDAESGRGGNVKPMPPMTADECTDLMQRLLDSAATRPLSLDECFMFGQLLSCYRQAIQAEMLTGKNGRYFVMSENDINSFLKATAGD